MYPVSSAFLQAVQENTRKYYWTGKITIKNGVVYEFGAEDIVKGSGYISSQCCGSTEIELGTVYAAEMGVTLLSDIDRYTLEDALVELFYHLRISKSVSGKSIRGITSRLRIKGITIEIGGDTTKLKTALKGVNTQVKSTQQQLKEVEKLLKLEPGNTELLAQKHKLLGEAVAATNEKLETLKTAAELVYGRMPKSLYQGIKCHTREIVEAFIDKILIYDPEHIEIRWKFPDEVVKFIEE